MPTGPQGQKRPADLVGCVHEAGLDDTVHDMDWLVDLVEAGVSARVNSTGRRAWVKNFQPK